MTYDECFEELRRLHAGFRREAMLTAERAAAFHAQYERHNLAVLRVAVDRALRDARIPNADELDALVDQAAEERRQAGAREANADAGRFLDGQQGSFSGYADDLWGRMHHALIIAMCESRLKLDAAGVERAKAQLADSYERGDGEAWIAEINALGRHATAPTESSLDQARAYLESQHSHAEVLP